MSTVSQEVSSCYCVTYRSSTKTHSLMADTGDSFHQFEISITVWKTSPHQRLCRPLFRITFLFLIAFFINTFRPIRSRENPAAMQVKFGYWLIWRCSRQFWNIWVCETANPSLYQSFQLETEKLSHLFVNRSYWKGVCLCVCVGYAGH